MRPPSLEDIAKEPLLGVLAVVEIALMMLARTLRGSHPDVDRAVFPGDEPVSVAARRIIDDCDVLLHSVDHFRDHLYERGRRHLADPDWPF
jgi:hypothetical protein